MAFALASAVGCAACGETKTPHRTISTSGSGAYEASLDTFHDGFVVAWHDTRDGNSEIYLRMVDHRGASDGPERRLTNAPQPSFEPDVAVVGDDIAVAWYEVNEARSLAKLGVWASDGTSKWVQTVSAAGGNGRNPVLLTNGRELYCAWIEHDGGASAVWGRWIDADGGALTPPQRLAPAGETTWNLNASLDETGHPWIVFDAPGTQGIEELFLVRVDGDGPHLLQLTEEDGAASTYPDIALGSDRLALTWFDERDGNREVYLAAIDYQQVNTGIDQRATRVTRTPGESVGAYVSWNGPHIGLAWSDDTEGRHEVYFQRFTAEATAVHPAQRVTTNPTASLIPAIEPAGSGFALAWNEDVVEERRPHGLGGRSEVVLTVVP